MRGLRPANIRATMGWQSKRSLENLFQVYAKIDINKQKKGNQMPTVSACPALIDDLPAIVALLADDVQKVSLAKILSGISF